jgi:uncharacterized protein YjiS (DUF1127 family)
METEMTNATTFHGGYSATTPGESWVSRFRKALGDRALYRRTTAELRDLSDRELRDLGLARHEIERVARQSVLGV